MPSDRDTVELFHLHFVRLLATGPGKANYVVKGGCNLRFFFGSMRYSQDLDLDVRGIPLHALKERVDGVLDSRALREALATAGIEVERTSSPKQTATTQRWKVGLRPAGRDVSLPTKIEFSRRDGEGAAALEAVDPRLIRRHRTMPILACHYLLPAAIRQKIGALVGRRQVQARDVFDLSLLFARAGEDVAGYTDLLPKVPEAVERVWAVSYADYRGQVAAYLEPEHTDALDSVVGWETMQLHVVSALESLGRRA
ncbi:MAG: nucleotidyl transferase AbiEii/AbiGii toxin family protein [Candidatus Latescibacterota bacterium]